MLCGPTLSCGRSWIFPGSGHRIKVACESNFPPVSACLIGFAESIVSHSYLDDLQRVAAERYIPSNGKRCQGPPCECFGTGLTHWRSDDILRARLKTVGVTEFRFEINKSEILGRFGPGASLSSGWHVYDVGGHRSMVRLATFADTNPHSRMFSSSSEVPVTPMRALCLIVDMLFF